MKKGRLRFADGRFIPVESAAAAAKRTKAEAAARAARSGAVAKPARRPRARKPRAVPAAAPAVNPAVSGRGRLPAAASGLYYLLAAIEFVEAG